MKIIIWKACIEEGLSALQSNVIKGNLHLLSFQNKLL